MKMENLENKSTQVTKMTTLDSETIETNPETLASFFILGIENIQTNALINSIKNQFEIHGEILESFEKFCTSKGQGKIILIDCSHYTFSKVFDALSMKSMRSKNINVALFNMKKDSRFESLVTLPQIKGIFYDTSQYGTLLSGLEDIIHGKLWLPRHLMQKMVDSHRKLPTFRASSKVFTKREQQILHSICRGHTNQDIAHELALSEHTIKSHLYNLFKKHNFRNRLEACAWARDQLETGFKFDKIINN